jgi:excisionase family DNA binding protein
MNDHLYERALPTTPASAATAGEAAIAARRRDRQVDDAHTRPLTGERHAAEHAVGGCLQPAGESQYVAPPAEGRPVPGPPMRGGPVRGDATAPVLLTVAQVMARLQVGRHTVYDLIRSRRLRSVLIGRCRRVPVVALREFLDSLTGGE